MAKVHPTEKLAIVVAPGSEVMEVITDKAGSLKEVLVVDGGPAINSIEVAEDELRFADLEERFQAAMDAAGCPDDEDDE